MSEFSFNPFIGNKKNHPIEACVNYFEIPTLTNHTFLEPSSHPLSYNYCKKHEILPIEKKQDTLIIATSNPFQFELARELEFILETDIEFHFLSSNQIVELIDCCFHHKEGSALKLIDTLSDDNAIKDEVETYDLLDQENETAPAIRLLNSLISEAITQRASDIHFEPIDETVRIRYRIDGVLLNRHLLPIHYKSNVMTRLKLMAKLDIAESRRPQDGRIKLKLGVREIDFRLSSIPVAHGERIVLRILDKENLLFGFDHLKMNSHTLETFKNMIKRSEGIVLVTGPTGSGKTTTLYSAVMHIHHEALNIMTIEDPVEYKLAGIAQIAVQPKIELTFAKGLRHILRQDPDVILIGEIRDLETAQIAIQAALTGHLVLSTLHTNDAPSAITRLVDMGIEPYLLSSSLIGVMAQRLVRTICTHCKESYAPSDKDLKALHLLPDPSYSFYRGKGCSVCHHTGYQGRQGIYELMPVQSSTKKCISESADRDIIRQCALNEGMISLKEQGRELILNGVTTVEELLRVVSGGEEV